VQQQIVVLTELTEDGMKDLFRNMDSIGVDLDDDVDINWANVWRIGELTTDRDPRFGLDDERTITFDLVVRVNYLDDSGDTQTDYYRVQGTIDEMENGLTNSDVHINSFNEVSKRFALPNR